MLREIFIRNLAIIDEARIDFHPGLNVLTGETGAGKSLLVGALDLVLGERAKGDWVRSGEEEALVEAVFDIRGNPELCSMLEDAGLPLEECLVVRRTVSRSGKNRIYVNDRATTLAFLEALGGKLVDIHGQHEHQSLLDLRRHRELIDLFGGHMPLVEQVTERYVKLMELQKRLANLEEEHRRLLSERDMTAHQAEEISKAQLRVEEEEELELERRKLLHTERLREICQEAEEALYSGGDSAVDSISRVQKGLTEASELDPGLNGTVEQMETARVYLEESAGQLREYLAGLEGDPARLEQIEERLSLIHRLKRKYHLTVLEMIRLGEELRHRMDLLDHHEDERKSLREGISRTREGLFESVRALSERRRQAAEKLESQMKRELSAVGMKETSFHVEMQGTQDGIEESGADDIRFEGRRVGRFGMDRIEFVIRPNPGQEFRPLRRIASGGELSRIMLALRNVLQRSDRLPTLVFDEVDAGIGGAEAEAVGSRLRSLSRDFQVLCVTHLAQIAVFGENHLKVNKTLEPNRTLFQVHRLDPVEREQEIARMLGGKSITPKTLAHAREMLARESAQ